MKRIFGQEQLDSQNAQRLNEELGEMVSSPKQEKSRPSSANQNPEKPMLKREKDNNQTQNPVKSANEIKKEEEETKEQKPHVKAATRHQEAPKQLKSPPKRHPTPKQDLLIANQTNKVRVRQSLTNELHPSHLKQRDSKLSLKLKIIKQASTKSKLAERPPNDRKTRNSHK